MLTWAIVLLIKTEFGDPIRIEQTPLGCVMYLSLFVSVLIAMGCDLVMVSIVGQMALAWAGCGAI